MSRFVVPCVVSLLLATSSFAFAGCKKRTHVDSPARVVTSFDTPTRAFDPRARFVLVGGGGEPDSSEVQLEADTRLAQATLRGPGITLFGGGPGRFSVREDSSPAADPGFREALGLLFLPRARAARIRAPNFTPDGSTSYETVTGALSRTLAAGTDPLVVVLATHGDATEDPLDAYALLWGNDALFVRDLVDLYSDPANARPSRTIVGACHGGAFSAIAEIGRSDANGAALHCGFFATEAERLASGCDGERDRTRHRSYLRSVFDSLASGRLADRDGDGRITMADAHLEAVVSLESIDVPIRTSDAFARDRAAAANLAWDSATPVASPGADFVSRELSRRLGIADAAQAIVALDDVRDALDEREEELLDLESARDVAWNRLRVALLERWPWLEDAYVAGWEARVESARRAIEPVLLRSDLAEALREAEARASEVAIEAELLRLREAMLSRLAQAYALPFVLGALSAGSPESYARYESLLACERFVPAVTPGSVGR